MAWTPSSHWRAAWIYEFSILGILWVAVEISVPWICPQVKFKVKDNSGFLSLNIGFAAVRNLEKEKKSNNDADYIQIKIYKASEQ
jgi:hypothetical protein